MPTSRYNARSFRNWPFRRHISIEIEAESRTHSSLAHLSNNINNRWYVKCDGSLHEEYSRELNSPIMNGDRVPEEVNHACGVLEAAGYRATEACGLHVHVDCEDLSARELHNLARLNMSLQDALNRHVPRRRYVSHWALASTYGHETINRLPSEQAVHDARRELSYLHDRYHGFNMCALTKFGSIEFRHLEGTINAEDILAWSYICTAFIENGRKVDKVLHAPTLRAKIAQLWAICDLPEPIRDWSYMRMVRFSPIVRGFPAPPAIRVSRTAQGLDYPVTYGVRVEDVPRYERVRIGNDYYGNPQYDYRPVAS